MFVSFMTDCMANGRCWACQVEAYKISLESCTSSVFHSSNAIRSLCWQVCADIAIYQEGANIFLSIIAHAGWNTSVKEWSPWI